ncbi:hypothetical protein PUN28_002172 [Cardiocondyla obscurior]|uniref:Uncharacterized protein n=1 Tax=Cardiocondyla obscurior TaxID=286306 RepID=A0AAW2GT13_9HYME
MVKKIYYQSQIAIDARNGTLIFNFIDSKICVQLFLLSHIIPPKGRVRGKRRQWKPSITECKDSFIIHTVLPADTVVIQERRKKVIKDLGLTLQPFIIVVGPQISDIDSAYVCVDKILYKVPSVLTALNICFKTFHVFNAIYPPESEHLWLLLQRILFMFSTKWDKMAPYVMEIITDMSNTDKENSV